MLQLGRYLFKQADAGPEFEQIHRLNYRTFVEEVPQHRADLAGLLIDKFHTKNVYFVALRAGRVVGMVSCHDRPPFSLVDRLPDDSRLRMPGRRPVEVRLLAIEPNERHTLVFVGLIWSLYAHILALRYTHLFISGVVERLPLYSSFGFQPLGPAQGDGPAQFVPMEVAVDDLAAHLRRPIESWQKRLAGKLAHSPVRLLPGPVPTATAVQQAFAEPPIYHRDVEFRELFGQVRRQLSQLVAAAHTAIFVGGGTLANDVVAATLAAVPGAHRPDTNSGLILVNGEFGQRLVRHAHRSGLSPRVLTWPWGQAWQLDDIARAMDRLPPSSWVWGVHQETSTGVLNDLPGLVRLAHARGLKVCADCISSLGAVPLDLSQVYLATGSSGKSLGSYAGLAFVFADPATLANVASDRVSSSLDLRSALANHGPLSTIPSPLVKALAAALQPYATPELTRQRFEHYAVLGGLVRQRLSAAGLQPLASESCASPVITTFAPPHGATSAEFVARCLNWGFEIAGHSDYLTQRNLVQLATMGTVSREECLRFFDWLERDQPIAMPILEPAADRVSLLQI